MLLAIDSGEMSVNTVGWDLFSCVYSIHLYGMGMGKVWIPGRPQISEWLVKGVVFRQVHMSKAQNKRPYAIEPSRQKNRFIIETSPRGA